MLRRLPRGRTSCRGVQQDGFDRRRTNAPQFCLNPGSGTQRITIDPHVLAAAVLSVHRRMTIPGIAPGPQVMMQKPALASRMVASIWFGTLIVPVLNLQLVRSR